MEYRTFGRTGLADVPAPEGTTEPRVGVDGLPLPGEDPRNEQQPPVFPGESFGEG